MGKLIIWDLKTFCREINYIESLLQTVHYQTFRFSCVL